MPFILAAGFVISEQGSSLIGTKAPEWKNKTWINSKPVQLSELKGRVVLIRFFTGTTCPFCSATAPALNEFHSKYSERGLTVVGMFTPKPAPEEVPLDTIRSLVATYNFQFPVAVDNDWLTLKTFWLDRVPVAEFTSVSFLIDKEGVIRYVHPGGEYSANSQEPESVKAYQHIKLQIEKLLGE